MFRHLAVHVHRTAHGLRCYTTACGRVGVEYLATVNPARVDCRLCRRTHKFRAAAAARPAHGLPE